MINGAYAGDLDVNQSWTLLAEDPRAVLVDVRTDAEWRYVGGPDLGGIGKRTVLLAWQLFPEMRVNTGFVHDLAATGVERDAPLLFLCRSGARSQAAAIVCTAAGFTRCYNIADGFEGPPDGAGHRGTRAGWKAAGLPWRQD